MKLGDRLKVEIIDLGFGGVGVFRTTNKVGFVPFVLVGEKVEVEVIEVKKKYVRAKKIQILQKSPERIKAKCEYFTLCGGCVYQHIDYQEQLKIKLKQWNDVIRRIGKIEHQAEEIIASAKEYHYRNKIALEVDKKNQSLAFHDKDNKPFMVDHCELADKAINAFWTKMNFKEIEDYSKVGLRKISNETLDEVVVFPINFPLVKAVDKINKTNKIKKNPRGAKEKEQEKITEKYFNGFINTGANIFYQTNHEMAFKVISIIKKWCQSLEFKRVLEGYSGCGFLTLWFQEPVRGFDSSRRNVYWANQNAKRINPQHRYFPFNDGDRKLEVFFKKNHSYFNQILFLLDPPRNGASKLLLGFIITYLPRYILYVSCNPTTLARDLNYLMKNLRYKISNSVLFDMFPQTAHIESMVLLTLNEKDN